MSEVAGAGGGTAGQPPTAPCLLAVRLDRCCEKPQPVTQADFDADPCWATWDPSGTLSAPRAGCTARDCDCATVEAETRVVEMAPGGSCRFASECVTSADCELFADARRCCRCPILPLPRSFEGQACWVTGEDSVPPRCSDCTGGVCNCPASTPASCVRTPSGLGRCVSATVHVEQGQCVAEQACPPDSVGARCAVCVEPGDMACGGPAPPPATCVTDTDCNAADNLVCEAAPCRNPACLQGCIADADCAPSEHCGADHRCAPAPCTSDSDCSLNRSCQGGRCERRRCTVSPECGDYCVNNTCYERPGQCADGCTP